MHTYDIDADIHAWHGRTFLSRGLDGNKEILLDGFVNFVLKSRNAVHRDTQHTIDPLSGY